MAKEVIPTKTPIPKVPKPTPTKTPIPNIPKPTPTTNALKPIPQKTSYKYAGKETLGEIIRKSIPEQFIPTKRMGTLFGAIFILVLIIAAFQFPYSSLMEGNIDLTIKVGFPWTFLELALTESDIQAIKPIGFTLDLLLYILIAYIIDIIISLIIKNPLIQSKKELKKKPTIFKNRKPSIVEKIVEKVAEKKQLKPTPQPINSSVPNQKTKL